MRCLFLFIFMAGILADLPALAAIPADTVPVFPLPLEAYSDAGKSGIFEVLRHRATMEPLNLVATIIFVLAIAHTFLASKFLHIAHRWRDEHRAQIQAEGRTGEAKPEVDAKSDVSFKAEVMHFLGEVEAIFGIWVVPLLVAFVAFKGWPAAERYISHGVHFTEPLFRRGHHGDLRDAARAALR